MSKKASKSEPTSAQQIDSMRDAYFAFWREVPHEGKAPAGIAFPNPVWEIVDMGPRAVRFKRAETKAAWGKLRRKFFREPWTSKWSDSYIHRAMQKAFSASSSTNSPEKVRDAMLVAVDTLDESPPTYRVMFAVSGVHTQEELAFGDDARIFQMSKPEYNKIVASFAAILKTMKHTATERKSLMNQVKLRAGELLNRTCAEIRAVGDEDKAQQVAEAIAEPMLDLLQLIAGAEDPNEIAVVAGVLPTRRPPLIMIKADGSHAFWRNELKHFHRVSIDSGMIADYRKKGMDALLVAIAKPPIEYSEFESLMVSSLHWIADAQRQPARANKVTSYITALEVFFAGSGPVVRELSDGVAYALEKSLKHRKRLKKKLEALYDRRSDVVHEGAREVTDQELYDLKVISINLLGRMSSLAPRFKSRDAVRAWIADMRLSAPSNAASGWRPTPD